MAKVEESCVNFEALEDGMAKGIITHYHKAYGFCDWDTVNMS